MSLEFPCTYNQPGEKDACVCFYCNKLIDSQIFTEHIIHCAQVLEECPTGCKMYFPRIRLSAHMKDCSNKRESSNFHNNDETSNVLFEVRLNALEEEIQTIRSVLNEEIRQRLHLITDVGSLRKQHLNAEERLNLTEQSLKLATQSNNNDQINLNEGREANIHDECFYQSQMVKSWIQANMKILEEKINDYNKNNRDAFQRININVATFQETTFELEKKNCQQLNCIENCVDTLTQEVKTKFEAISDLSEKQANMDNEIKSLKNIISQTEERCEDLRSIIAKFEKGLLLVEKNQENQQHNNIFHYCKGHFIWRITNYSTKLQEAKQYDAVLHSALFSNHPFGYTLRLDVYLNGKGSWKGRNAIACLNVVAGEFDALLPWPCRLQAQIIIRDQTEDLSKVNDYLKTIKVRKKNEDHIKFNQYFHIPHQIIESKNYLRNNTIFIEVKIIQN